MQKISIFSIIGLPEAFGVVLLVFAFILIIAPYFPEGNFGVFNIPKFSAAHKSRLKWTAPLVFAFLVFLFLPIWSSDMEYTLTLKEPENRISDIPTVQPSPLNQQNEGGGFGTVVNPYSQVRTVSEDTFFNVCDYTKFTAKIIHQANNRKAVRIRSEDRRIPDREYPYYEKIFLLDKDLEPWPNCRVRFEVDSSMPITRIIVRYSWS